jgi:hypothetical protein
VVRRAVGSPLFLRGRSRLICHRHGSLSCTARLRCPIMTNALVVSAVCSTRFFRLVREWTAKVSRVTLLCGTDQHYGTVRSSKGVGNLHSQLVNGLVLNR